MSDVLYRATKYMNVEDTLLAPEVKPRKRERPEDGWQDKGWKMAKTETVEKTSAPNPPLEGSQVSPS